MKKSDPVQHTIDKKHSQMLEEFHNNETIHIPELIAQKQSLRLQLRSLNVDQIVQYMELKDNENFCKFNSRYCSGRNYVGGKSDYPDYQ